MQIKSVAAIGMLYLVTGEYIENSVSAEAFPQVWETVIRPSLELLAKMVEEKKITGGVLAGQKAAAFVFEAQSNEELDKTIGALPFWGLVKWHVTPLTPVRSAIERDRRSVEAMKAAKH